MDQPEAMQEDRDNWNQEEMLEAAVGLINLDSDLRSSGTSSASPPDSDSDCDGDRYLVARPFAHEKSDTDLPPRGLMHSSLRNNASTSRST